MDKALFELQLSMVGTTGGQHQRRKLMLLLTTTIENMKRTFFSNRRRSQHRMRRRQALLRNFFSQQMYEMENNFMMPIPLVLPEISADQLGTSDDEQIATESGYYEIAAESFSDAQWLQAFRMSRRTFHWLCNQLNDVLQPLVGAVALAKSIAVALYAYVSGEDCRVVALLFSVPRTAVCKYMYHFAEALVKKLGNKLLAMPRKEQEYEDISAAFERASNLPPIVVGVLGVCSISATATGTDDSDGVGGNGIILQALIDDHLLFRKVDVVEKKPTLLINNNNVLTTLPRKMINGCLVPYCAIAPQTSYPLLLWLMHGYKTPAAPHEHVFNAAVRIIEHYKERAFYKLFSRWQILQRKNYLNAETMRPITIACCALHNLLEENEEDYMKEWEKDVEASRWHDVKLQSLHSGTISEHMALELRDFIAFILNNPASHPRKIY